MAFSYSIGVWRDARDIFFLNFLAEQRQINRRRRHKRRPPKVLAISDNLLKTISNGNLWAINGQINKIV